MEDWLAQRVLAHVPTPQLHESFNAVLQEELDSVTNALSDVAAAFAKLQEVRDAVSQLERNPGGSSASLMAAAGNTMLLQREIGDRIGQLATGMEVAGLARKRKREEEVDTQEAKVARSRVRTDEVETIGERGGGVRQQVDGVCTESRTSGETEQMRSGELELSVMTNGGRRKVERERVESSSTESSSESESDEDGDSGATMEPKDLDIKSRRPCEKSTQDVQGSSLELNTVMNGVYGEAHAETAEVSDGSDDELERGDDDENEVEGTEAAMKALRRAGSASKNNSQEEEDAKGVNVESGRPTTPNKPVMTSKNLEESTVMEEERGGAIGGKTASSAGSSSDSDSASDEDEVEGSEAAWKALMSGGSSSSSKTSNNRSPVQDVESNSASNFSTGHTLKKSATYLKRIVEDVNRLSKQDRSFIIPEILIALKESVEDDEDATQQAEVAWSLNILIGWWGTESGEHIHHLKLYRAYAEAVKTYVHRLPTSAQRMELQRLVNSLSGVLTSFGKLAKGTARASVTKRFAHQLNWFMERVGDADNKSFSERKQRLLGVFVAFKKETFVHIDGNRLLMALNKVARWLFEDPREMQELHIYRMLVRAAQQVSDRIRDPVTFQSYVSLLERMLGTIADPSSGTSRKFLLEIEHRAVQVFQKVKRSNEETVSSQNALDLIAEVESLVNHAAYGWYPRQDITICKCVEELKSAILRLRRPGNQNSKRACSKRLARIAKWGVRDPPETVRQPTTASELRGKCLSAVQGELQHAETQLQPALTALKRALSVVQASRKMYSAPLALMDESPDVSRALGTLVAACNEVGALVCEISRHVSSSEGGDASSSATDDEEPNTLRAEPKSDVNEAVVEKKKAAKETMGRIKESTTDVCGPPASSAAVIDLSLSDDENVVKDEPGVKEEKKNLPKAVATIQREEVEPRRLKAAKKAATMRVKNSTLMNERSEADGGNSSVRNEEVNSREAPMEDEDSETEVVGPPRRRKRKAPRRVEPPTAKRPVRDVVVRLGKRAQMAPSGPVGEAVRSALNAAIAVEDCRNTTEMGALISAFVGATAEAGKKLVKVHAQHPVQAERHLEDMRLLMSVAVVNLERELTSDQVRMAWKMTAALQHLHSYYPVKTKGLNRNCQQLYKYLVKEHKVPAAVVKHFKSKLGKVMEEVADWAPFDELTVRWFDKQMDVVNELLGSQFEQWNPSTDPVLGKVVANLERICTFGVDDSWNDRYASICRACSKMSRTTFVWSFNLEDRLTNRLIRCNDLEPGIEDKARVENDFEHVTSYDEKVRQARTPDEKKAAFDELIDRLRWIFNAVAMTKNQSLLPLHRFKRLNECLDTLASLCDNGDALNLEGCIHLEKLLVVMRQVMHIRIDYADISKRETEMLLGLFPPEKRPRFGYPPGCKHST